MKKITIFLIKLYQLFISPFLGQNCKYIPTCSQYFIDSINVNGMIKGIIIGLKRIVRCNPYCKGGYDPIIKKNDI